ncbi:MAG: PTS glucose transporter subunit IIA [Haemophilus parainfluenzae]|nr:PTS glucose transporter subunit IIA [Haemophilus parainfluenzae]
MGLFDKLFGSKENKAVEVEIYAPLSGEIVNIEDVPDVVFSEKIVGDGIAIRSVLTPVVISNMDEISSIEKKSGEAIVGESIVLTLKK